MVWPLCVFLSLLKLWDFLPQRSHLKRLPPGRTLSLEYKFLILQIGVTELVGARETLHQAPTFFSITTINHLCKYVSSVSPLDHILWEARSPRLSPLPWSSAVWQPKGSVNTKWEIKQGNHPEWPVRLKGTLAIKLACCRYFYLPAASQAWEVPWWSFHFLETETNVSHF